jgi:hypothetical protein
MNSVIFNTFKKNIDYVIEGDNGPSNLIMTNVPALCEDLVDNDKEISDG